MDIVLEDLARQWIADGATVMHVETGVVGKAKMVRQPTGEPRAVTVPVLELDNGHAFILRDKAFILLKDNELAFYLQMVAMVSMVLTEGAKLGAAMKVDPEAGLRLQLSTLEAAVRGITKAP